MPIIEHSDVKRMLLSMKARTEAMRALSYFVALELDKARRLPDEAARTAALHRAELLIPVVKGWCTETAVDVTSTGIQVHGGMGFIEETGAAQFLRDVRIASIYEGTTGIQANDLVGRKLGRDRGAAMALLHQGPAGRAQRGARAVARGQGDAQCGHRGSDAAARRHRDAVAAACRRVPSARWPWRCPTSSCAGSCSAVRISARGAVVAEAALQAAPQDDFYRGKLQTARFYAEQLLPDAPGLARW